jgi:signal transduction histidine kinase
MTSSAISEKPRGLALALGWPRVRFALGLSLVFGLMLSPGWTSGLAGLFGRIVLLGVIALLVFGLFEQWPRRLPRWLARWVLQVVGVGLAMPISTAIIYWLSTPAGAPAFYHTKERMDGFVNLTMLGVLIAPWAALAALVRQKDALARHQALAFELERSELERQALDARLRVLQTQVAPHFLFNTLANVQALVETGSPQAPAVLRSLIAYLRAAVPRLDGTAATFDQELQLVHAYLELMHMRMPDRLQFAIHADPSALGLLCPPMTILTLVENAVRHGIDPGEEGGRIDVTVQRRGDRCLVRVSDTGVGLRTAGGGLGTGLATLRERLELAFDGDARLHLGPQQPAGVCVELELPARETIAR